MRALIVGCGYVGLPLGAELVTQGHEVFGLRRDLAGSEALADAGIKPLVGDVTRLEDLKRLEGPFDWVINTVSSTKGGVEEYRSVYLEGTRNLIQWLAGTPIKRYIYTSSTSVYGQCDATAVKETSVAEPLAETAKVLVQTEQLLQAAFTEKAFPAIVLRVAGIYGPDRGHHFHQFLKDEARIHGKGDRIINMIHRDDLVGVITRALKSGRAGEIYNVVDDEPVQQIYFFRWLSETLGKWMPPNATEEENAARKRGLTNKKVQNRKLKMELGYQLKYPTFRQGYTAEIIRLEREHKLHIKPACRDHLTA